MDQFSRMTETIKETITDALDDQISNIDIHLTIDGMRMDPEECTEEIDRTGGEININMILGLKRIIQRHPSEYIEALHWPLFDDSEREEIERKKDLFALQEINHDYAKTA